MNACHYCGSTTEELRPYGPGGSLACFPCATATPERNAKAKAAFGAILEANEAISPTGATVLGAGPPRPLEIHEAEEIERAMSDESETE